MKQLGAGTVAALYARVSTKEGKQHLENQLQAMRTYARRQRWKIEETYTDEISGAADNRPGLDRMFADAAAGLFDVLLVFDLSRLTRGGPATAFAQIERLTKSGVEFWSLREEYFRTPIAGPILIAIAAFLAQQERVAMQDRIRAGILNARNRGVRFGRPRRIVDAGVIQRLRKQGLSLRKIASRLKCGRGTVDKILKQLEAEAARK